MKELTWYEAAIHVLAMIALGYCIGLGLEELLTSQQPKPIYPQAFPTPQNIIIPPARGRMLV